LGAEGSIDPTKENTGPVGPSPASQEALGTKNLRTHRADPGAKDPFAPPPESDQNKEAGTPPPEGEDTKDTFPVDYNLEIEVEFPTEMVIELQKSATLRARKTVIGRTLSGRVSFKELQDCLKLHLPALCSTITLLTRGYFEVLFDEEEGARATRKLGVVEWSGWALSFSRYSALFRPNE
jgi:hypothetical protein